MMRFVFFLTLVLLFVTGSGVLASGAKKLGELAVPTEQYGLLARPFKEGTLLFVPDIMLGRGVETLMEERGTHVPFEKSRAVLSSHDVTIGNFEAAVPERHTKTKNNVMQFSVRESYIGLLKDVGFDLLSLANNHSLDYGEEGYQNTRAVCFAYDVLCVGHGDLVTTYSVAYQTVGDAVVGILMLNASEDQVDVENLKKLLREMEEKTDLTIVFVHWGEEYRTVHTDAQELLAHVLIDSGADAIIGHHPHVVEDVDEYRGKPIFYSLGNFIFDQYWGPEVEEGYAVRVTLKKRSVTYELLPYIMKERSAPEFIDGEEHTTFLKKYMPTGVFFDGSETYSRE